MQRPRSRSARIVQWLLIAIVCVYALVCVVFALVQKRLLYFPARFTEAEEQLHAAHLGGERVRSAHGDTLGFFVPSPTPATATLIVAHGNGGNALGQARFVDLARASGVAFDLFLVEYPGYGTRRGTPGEAVNVAAVREAIARYDDKPIVLFGESLGSAVVSIAAAERPDVVRALVLITPLPSLVGPTRFHYPYLPTLLLRDRYEADAAIARFGGPVAFIVASRDEVIPAELALAMHGAYRGPKALFIEPEAGHNTVDYTPGRPTWLGVNAFVTRALARP